MRNIRSRHLCVVLVCLTLSVACLAAPSIASLSPASGPVGLRVTISGADFGATQAGSTVSLNGTGASVGSWSDTAIVAVVPTGAASGPFTVTVNGEAASSSSFTVTPLPIGWADGDIGTVGLAGSATYGNGVFAVKGAGTQISGTSDGFHFVYQLLSGDGSISARVSSKQGISVAQVGVMIRETLSPGSAHALAFCGTSQANFYYRPTTGASVVANGISFSALPYWVKLVRSGNVFTPYVSLDGLSWMQMASSATIAMAQNVYIGLAVSSNSTSTLEIANIDNVSVSSTSAPAPVISSLSATTGPIGSQVTVMGSGFGPVQGSSMVTLNGAPVTINSWSSASIVLTIPAGATTGPLLVVTSPSLNYSNYVTFTITSQPLPSGWLDADIGAVGLSGNATYATGTFTEKGAGNSVSGTADAFHFVYRPLSGDGSIVARVYSLQGTSLQQAGVMIRETLSSASTNALVFLRTSQAYLYSRTATGANVASNYISYSSGAFPYWVKLTRTGNVFTAYVSHDGFEWAQIGSATIPMSQNAYIGLAVSGTSTSTLETATFDNVSVNSAAAPAPVISSVSATTGSIGTQVAIGGANFGFIQGASLVMLNGSPVTINSWDDTLIVFTVPSGATSGSLLVMIAPSMNGSNSVSFTVTSQPLPNGWLDRDIGNVTVAGSAAYAGGTFTISGGGYVGSTADSMHFVYQPLAGDGSITARVMSLQGSAAVLMVRETLNSNSANAYVSLTSNGGTMTSRTTTGGNAASVNFSLPSATLPYWVRLIRTGNTFTAYQSKDGSTWFAGSTTLTVAMASSVYIGMGVPSMSNSSGTAVFTDVSVNSAATPAPVITAVSATTASIGSQVAITGANFSNVQGGSQVTLNGTPVTVNAWNDTSIIVTIPAGATSGLLLVAVAPSMNASNPIYFTVTSQPLPSPWLDRDIGNVTQVGSAGYSGGTFSVSGGGYVGSTADSMHFVYQPLSGDGSITARVVSLQGLAASLMVRETLTSNSADAYVTSTGWMSNRSATGASVISNAGSVSGGSAVPYWLKLVRIGNAFTAYSSVNGSTWAQGTTTMTVPMAPTVYIGMVVPNMSNSSGTATFDNVSVIVGTTPYVGGVVPVAGGVGTAVTITGSNFGDVQGSSTVSFNGTQVSSITSWSSSQIVAIVPDAPGRTGPVVVTVNSISSNASVTFAVINPVIASLSPPSGARGGRLTVNGSGFGSSQGNSTVKFNDIVATAYPWSDTGITVYVPSNATSGPVTVTNNGVVSNGAQFMLEGAPAITAFFPTSGPVGSTVTISGSGFGATQSSSTVQFNAVPAAVTSWSDTEIAAVVPGNSASGPISVTVAALVGENGPFVINTTSHLTDSLGHVSAYTATMLGGAWIVVSSQGPGCSTCSIRGDLQNASDANGNILSTTDALGHATTYTYNGNNLQTASQPLDANTTATWSYTYNSFGEALTATDPLGNTTTNTYDTHGNLLTVTTPKPDAGTAGSVTQFAYDTKGELTSITDPLNHVTTLTYTPAGLIGTITDVQQHVTTYGYDAHGNRTSVIDAMNHQTTFAYDAGDRLTTITYPDQTVITFGYDTRGRRTSVMDQNGKQTTYAYDDADRLISVTDAAQHVTQYSYDSENNLTSITDANGHTTSFAYDPFGRVMQTTFPSSLFESYVYDAIGNLTSKTDRKNQTIQYVYDALNRLSHKGYPDSSGVDYIYDLAGKIKQASDPTGTYGFAYDNMGRLIGTTTQYAFLPGNTYTNAYVYDAASNRTGFTAPDGSTNTYAYDNLNRLSTLTNSITGQFGFGYDALSRRTSLTRPNNVSTSYGYDSLSHLLSILHQASGATIDGATHTYDNAGNRVSKLNQLNGVTENYTYDSIYQLTRVQQLVSGTSSTSESYSYDAVGNRLSSLNVPSYSYNSSNQLTSSADGYTYTYDANGNTLTKANASGTTQYGWDFENRLMSVTLPNGGGVVGFKYDPSGRRAQKSSPSGTINYIYDGNNLIEELDGTGAILARYAQTMEMDEPVSMVRGGSTSYYSADGLGSATSLTNSAAALAQTYTFDAFGKVTGSTGSLTNSFQYTAREFDSETGLLYMRARHYDFTTGRFLSEDPLAWFVGPNFYAYVDNDPINDTDPLGLSPGGPKNPRVKTRCKTTDSCSTLQGKILLLERTITSHQGWDWRMPWPRGGGRHSDEIADFWSALARCINIYEKKCKNCDPEPGPAPSPSPVPKQIPGPMPIPIDPIVPAPPVIPVPELPIPEPIPVFPW